MVVQTQYFPLGGGLDVATPSLTVPPGRLLSCSNFEPDVEGGYRLTPGYERYDGSDSPHDQSFFGLEADVYVPERFPYTDQRGRVYQTEEEWAAAWSPLSSDRENTDRLSARLVRLRDPRTLAEEGIARVCGMIWADGDTENVQYSRDRRYWIGLFRVSGKLERGQIVGERVRLYENPAGTDIPIPETRNITPLLGVDRPLISSTTVTPGPDVREDWLRIVREVHRASIGKPAGSGPIRGVWSNNMDVYAWRDDQIGRQTVAYQASVVPDLQRRIEIGKYNEFQNRGDDGFLEAWDKTGRVSQETGQARYEQIQTLVLSPVGINTSDDNARVDMVTAFQHTRPGDAVRLRAVDGSSGASVEYVLLTEPALRDGLWRLSVELQHIEGNFTNQQSWFVEIETGIFEVPGWHRVPDSKLCKVLKFCQGRALAAQRWQVGDRVSADGFSATIHKIIVWAGGYDTDNACGYLVVRDVQGAFLRSAPALVSQGINQATYVADSLEDFDIPAGARMRFETHNFFGTEGTERIYACGGGKLFEIDENGYFSQVLIPTVADLSGFEGAGGADDYGELFMPVEHGNALFVAAQGGRLINSVNGNPMNFSAILSAAEFGLGHEIVGMESVAGEVLVIATTRNVKALYGTAAEGYELRNISEKQGILLDSLRKVDDIYAVSWAGIAGVTRTDQFGDFNSDTISNVIAPILQDLRPSFTCSSIVRRDNLYRAHYAGKRPHYELGTYRRFRGEIEEEPSTLTTNNEEAQQAEYRTATLVLPRTDATQWLESAAGGDILSKEFTAVARREDVVANTFHVSSTELVIRTDKDTAFFTRVDKTDKDYRGAICTIQTYNQFTDNEIIGGVFTIDKRTSVSGREVVFSGSFRAHPVVSARGIAAFDMHNLIFQAPPKITDGQDAQLIVRNRRREDVYEVRTYVSQGSSDPDNPGAEPATCVVHVRPVRVSDDVAGHHLSTHMETFELAVKTDGQTSTETITMYVPERGAISEQRETQPAERVQFGRTALPVAIDAVWEPIDEQGERIFFSGADGQVYEDRKGTSFDGQPITAFVRTHFVHLKKPAYQKQFRRMDLELSSLSSIKFRVVMDLDFNAPHVPSLQRIDERAAGAGGFWDTESQWNQIDWDGSAVTFASTELHGSGVNASFLLVFETDNAESLSVQGMLLHYSMRRRRR